MKINVIPIIVMLLASAIVLPVGLSYAQGSTNTTSAQTMAGSNGTMMMHSNAMGVGNIMNSTAQTGNNTQAAQQVSDFIHQAVVDFKQQGTDTRQVILDCISRVQAAGSGDTSKINQDCSVQLNAITAKYQSERIHYHDLIKQYRQSVMVFLNDARGLAVSKTTMDSAIAQLSMMMNTMSSGTMMGHTSTMNNTHCVNSPGGPQTC